MLQEKTVSRGVLFLIVILHCQTADHHNQRHFLHVGYQRKLSVEIQNHIPVSRAVPLTEGHWSHRATSLSCHPTQSCAGGLSKAQRRDTPAQQPSPRHRPAGVGSTAASLLRVRGLVNLACLSSPERFLDTSKLFKPSKQTGWET